jgi:hypothetical protein
MMRIAAAVLSCLAVSAPAFAGVIYSSGPVTGCCYAVFIDGPSGSPGQSISDGFVAAENGTATSFDFGVDLTVGATPTTVTWKLGTSAFAGDISSGVATSPAYNYVTTVLGALDVYLVHVTGVSGTFVAGNTYYLSLDGADDSLGDHYVAWDSLNTGTATCSAEQGGVSPHTCTLGGSQAFTIFDSSAPEPAGTMLIGGGLLGLAGLLRRKRR